MTREFDPRRLDVTAFTEAQGALTGGWPLEQLQRLSASSLPPEPGGGNSPVQWRVDGEHRRVTGGPAQRRLRIEARARVWLTCQRCLEPLEVPLQVDCRVRFVRGEDEAARLDEEGDEDVLALPRQLDLAELVEDELILAMPLVPMHDDCQLPAGAAEAADPADAPAAPADEPAADHPFAALAGWRKTPG